MKRFICAAIAGTAMLGGAGIAAPAHAYDDRTTHPALTQEIIAYYNLLHPDAPIGEQEREWIIAGSIAEDTPPRWINHFYDPIRTTGWSGANAGIWPAAIVNIVARAGIVADKPVSTIEWLHDENKQEQYRYFAGNRTWERGLRYYAEGDREEAYRTLGHALHLLHDMSVPDHVRDDTHAHALEWITGDPGSPHEAYARQWTRETIASLNIPASLANEGAAVPDAVSPDEYLAGMARYANQYFFSRDTIGDAKYAAPKIIREDGSFGYGRDEKGKEFPLVSVELTRDGIGRAKKTYTILERAEYHPMLRGHFERLARQAVLNGTGILALFEKEAARKAYATTGARRIAAPVISLFGAARLLNSALHTAGNFFGKDEEPATLVVRRQNGTPTVSGTPRAATTTQISANGQQTKNAADAVPAAPKKSGTTKKQISSPQPAGLSPRASTSTITKDAQPAAASPKAKTAAPPSAAPAPRTASNVPAKNSASAGSGNGSGGGSNNASTGNGGVSSSPAQNTSQGASAGAQSSGGASASSSTPSLPSRVLISEIQVGGPEDAADEFVELYNAGEGDADISGWSLQYISAAADSLGSLKKRNFSEGMKVRARRYFLIARGLSAEGDDGYRGSVASDFSHRTISMSGAASGGTVLIVTNDEAVTGADDPDIADMASYGEGPHLFAQGGSAPQPEAGSSIERKALLEDVCAEAAGAHSLKGNGCDTNNDAHDFAVRARPFPQNSAHLPEPRDGEPEEPPSEEASSTGDGVSDASSTASAIGTFAARYSSGSLAITLSFEPPEGTAGTSTRYSVFDVSAGDSALLFESNTAFSRAIEAGEVGRAYHFELRAEQDGTVTGRATSSVSAPDFVSKVHFYRDPRDPARSYLIDVFYDAVPFIPPRWSDAASGRNWQGMVFYLNRAPNSANNLLTTNSYLAPQDPEGVMNVAFDRRAAKPTAIFAFSPEFVREVGGGLHQEAFLLPREDGYARFRYTPGARDPELASGDYLTIGYYDFSRVGGGTQDLSLVARGARRYPFEASPPAYQAPAAPGALVPQFDFQNLNLSLAWDAATDADTEDSALTYEIAFATSSFAGFELWRELGNAVTTAIDASVAGEYHIGVRAVDEFGNSSEESRLIWEFPPDFVPLPRQMSHAEDLGRPDGGQLVRIPRAARIGAILLWNGNFGGQSYYTESHLEIRRDQGGAPGALIATSTVFRSERNVYEQEAGYRFEDLSLEAETSYWIVPVQGARNEVHFYGSRENPYGYGGWSPSPGSDIYFRFIEAD